MGFRKSILTYRTHKCQKLKVTFELQFQNILSFQYYLSLCCPSAPLLCVDLWQQLKQQSGSNISTNNTHTHAHSKNPIFNTFCLLRSLYGSVSNTLEMDCVVELINGMMKFKNIFRFSAVAICYENNFNGQFRVRNTYMRLWKSGWQRK